MLVKHSLWHNWLTNSLKSHANIQQSKWAKYPAVPLLQLHTPQDTSQSSCEEKVTTKLGLICPQQQTHSYPSCFNPPVLNSNHIMVNISHIQEAHYFFISDEMFTSFPIWKREDRQIEGCHLHWQTQTYRKMLQFSGIAVKLSFNLSYNRKKPVHGKCYNDLMRTVEQITLKQLFHS